MRVCVCDLCVVCVLHVLLLFVCIHFLKPRVAWVYVHNCPCALLSDCSVCIVGVQACMPVWPIGLLVGVCESLFVCGVCFSISLSLSLCRSGDLHVRPRCFMDICAPGSLL